MNHGIWKKFCAFTLTAALTLGCVPTAFAQEGQTTIADWRFGAAYAQEGTGIQSGDLTLLDQSGNHNDLKMQLYANSQPTQDTTAAAWENYLSFSDEDMNGSGDGSLLFHGDSTKNAAVGADFVTVPNAPINKETFTDGYTLEFLYQFPADWTEADKWMGLLSRQADPDAVKGMNEPELGSASVAVSNCKEVQFVTAPAADDHRMESAAWSVSMDEGGVWYHIAITSENHVIRVFINGCEAFRDYLSDDMVGMYADPADGRFRIGSSWWREGNQSLDKFLQGNLQQVRISAGALEKAQWLIPNPEAYLGEYGSNEAYTLTHSENYNFVFLPDTQNTVKFRPDVMDAAIDGLISTAAQYNVAGVVGLGDVVENADSDKQYQTAKDIFYQLPERGVPFLIQPGNHDDASSADGRYQKTFGSASADYMALTADYLKNDSPSGASSYMFVQAGSYHYLVISLACTGNGSTGWNRGDEAWLQDLLRRYPASPTILTSHDVQNCSDTNPSAVKLSGKGRALWDLVKDYNQVFMLVGGHSHGAGYEILTNTAGNSVVSVLADYQFAYNGGNGFFKYAEFDETDDCIYLKTYSPYAAALADGEKGFFDVNFMTGPGNADKISLEFETRFLGMKKSEAYRETGYENGGALDLSLLGRAQLGAANPDGGVAEIVAYSRHSNSAYVVNGQAGTLDIVSLAPIPRETTLTAKSVNVQKLAEAANPDFVYGDMTGVAVGDESNLVAVALQAKGFADDGCVALLDRSGALRALLPLPDGKQPDMLTFTPDGKYLLVANEGEPRAGYTAEDPAGSVSIITLDEKNPAAATVQTVGFSAFDAQRAALVAAGVVMKKDAMPSTDFEPEYIACDRETAYVSLQEANAVATLDLKTMTFTAVQPLGAQDYATVAVDLDNSYETNTGAYTPKHYADTYGLRMPDGISLYKADGKTYLLTANEGDSRDWPGYTNEDSKKLTATDGSTTTKKVTLLKNDTSDGLIDGKNYVFGGRSFSIFDVTDGAMALVYDSGAEFEQKTAQYLADFFNVSNDKLERDGRSNKKGCEPESVTVGVVAGKPYAFIALERVGGVMAYDLSSPAAAEFVNYCNPRDFTAVIGGDVAPEGLCFVPAAASATGTALLLVANEVSGTMTVLAAGARPIDRPSGGAVTTTPKPEPTPTAFEDVQDHWAGDAIAFVTEKGLFAGTGEGRFSPDAPMTRAMVWTVLYRYTGKPAVAGADADLWYGAAQMWSVQQQLSDGANPADRITREDLVTILWRFSAEAAPPANAALTAYADAAQVSTYAQEAVRWACDAGVLTGKPGNRLDPQGKATRAEVAVILARFLSPKTA